MEFIDYLGVWELLEKMVESILSFYNIKKIFGKNEVLEDVSFYVEEGDILGFVGKSGSGKSTLLNILLGILSPNSGKIYFRNKNVTKKSKELKKEIGYVSQDNSLFPELSLEENSYYFGKLYSVNKKIIKQRFSNFVKLLGFEGFENFKLSTFSGGMIKRANILVSLIHNPKILILDEPTVGLDPILREELWHYIRELNKKEKITVLLVTHLLGEVDDNCNKVAVLKKGKIFSLAKLNEYRKAYDEDSFSKIFKEIMK